jgi:E3 ubiquitin-protein ligase MARCH6
MFEDDDIPVIPQDPPVLNPAPVNQPAPELNGRLAAPPRVLDRDIDAPRQARLLRPRRPIPPNARFEPQPRHFEDVEWVHGPPFPQPQIPLIDPPPPIAVEPRGDDMPAGGDKGKAKEEDDEDAEVAFSDLRRRIRRRLDNVEQDITPPKEAGPSTSTAASAPSSHFGHSTAVEPTSFEFTFKPPTKPLNGHADDVREPIPEMPGRSLAELQAALLAGTPIPEEQPRPRSFIAPELPTPKVPSRASTPDPEPEPFSSSSKTMHVQIGPGLRRPPMSSSTVNAEGDSTPPKLQPVSPSSHLVSPNLATYVAPEELEAGSSSSPTGYFDGKKRARDDTEDEFKHYFRDPQPATSNDDNSNDGHKEIPRPEEDGNLNGLPRLRVVPVEEEEDDEDEAEAEEVRDHDFWDADADAEGDDEDDDFDNFDPLNRPGAQPPQAQMQAAVEQMNEVVDDLEAGVEDDLDGALEGKCPLMNPSLRRSRLQQP